MLLLVFCYCEIRSRLEPAKQHNKIVSASRVSLIHVADWKPPNNPCFNAGIYTAKSIAPYPTLILWHSIPPPHNLPLLCPSTKYKISHRSISQRDTLRRFLCKIAHSNLRQFLSSLRWKSSRYFSSKARYCVVVSYTHLLIFSLCRPLFVKKTRVNSLIVALLCWYSLWLSRGLRSRKRIWRREMHMVAVGVCRVFAR
jgi:hypothetical protein